jgi:hypothetical protein
VNDPRITWHATSEGTAHAYYGNAKRSLCGQVARHDPRWDWPPRVHCGKCSEIAVGVAR